jgi:hypothetical protein
MMTSLEKKKLEEENRYKNIGFTIREVGIGDGVQFTSLPENFFKKTGQKLIDVSKPWYLDYNPYIERDKDPQKTIELWNYPRIYDWNPPRQSVYLSNAEVHLNVFGMNDPHLIRPRLYQFENFPFEKRKKILFHPLGKSHGQLPKQVVDHVVRKYASTGQLYEIGDPRDPSLLFFGSHKIHTPTLWDLVKEISECRMFIGIDSGPAWIAACFPDVIVKKIRTKFQYGYCEPKDWVALDVKNEHSFWDDRCFQIYNCFEDDVGFTYSYKKL